jgi:glycosyltransferase involved in cell wall biosynthesis
MEAGGAERMAVNIANVLADAGHDSHLCVTRKEGLLKESIDDQVNYLFLEKKGKIGWNAILKLRNYIKKHNIEVVHAHSTSAFIGVLSCITLQNKLKFIWHDHYGKANELEARPAQMLQLISYFFDHVISVNQLLRRWAIDKLKSKQVTFLENFAVKSKESQLSLPLKGIQGKRMICLANLREQKDHLNLIHAFAGVHEDYKDWTLHLCGQDFNDAYSLKVKNLITEKNLQNHVFLLGSRSDVSAALNECNIAVLSSKSEGLPVALLEYGLHKLPVITTDVGACAEVIKEHGIVVPSQDSIALSKALIDMVNNESNRQTLASKFHHHVIENYGTERYVEKLLVIYTS